MTPDQITATLLLFLTVATLLLLAAATQPEENYHEKS